MTTNDQTIPANLTRAEAQAVREWAERARDAQVQDETVVHAARVLLTVLPKRPTLADMTWEERDACQWMQADTETWGRAVIIIPDLSDGCAALLDRRGKVPFAEHGNITPRPGLPRMEWPGDKKPAPAPALPGRWRPADHLGYDWGFCPPDELTYLDTEQEVDQ